MARLELYVQDGTRKLYYQKFYEAKQRDNTITHDVFMKNLMGLR